MDFPDLSKLSDLTKQMEDAYSQGMGAMNQAGKEVAKDMNPDHEIFVDIKISANIEGKPYKVDGTITFNIELDPILAAASSPMGNLSSLLDGLDVDLGNDKDAVMEQLGQPRAIGVVKSIDIKKIELHNDKGKLDVKLNKDGTLLATIKDDKILVNFESVLSFPEHTDAYVAIPSMEMMQKNISLDIKKLDKEVKFSWEEKDKDNLKVSGDVKLLKI